MNIVPSFGLLLNRISEIFLPLVQYLDQELPGLYPFFDHLDWKHVTNRRGMLVFDGFDVGLPSFALQRSGEWVIPINYVMRVMTAGELAAHLQQEEVFSRFQYSSLGYRAVKMDFFLPSAPFLERLIQFHMYVWVMEKCHTTVAKMLQEREERIKIMQQRLGFFQEFSQALDPVKVSNQEVRLPGFSVFRKTEHGEARMTGTYFSKSALASTVEPIKSVADTDTCYVKEGGVNIDTSLTLIDRVYNALDSITKAKDVDHSTAKSLYGCSTGRLPLHPDELAELERVVNSI